VSTARAISPLCLPSNAVITLPGSKSEANRLLVAAALSGGYCNISIAEASDDVRHLVTGLTAMGYGCEFVIEDASKIRVFPRLEDGPTQAELHCGNAGTAFRFLMSVAAITPGDWLITGDEHMLGRPVQPLVDAWQQLGIPMESRSGLPPIRIHGGTPKGGEVTLDVAQSSQFLSSLLLIGSRLPNGLKIQFKGELASRSYARLTCSMLARFGIHASIEEHAACVLPGPATHVEELQVSGDWSCMGVWACLNHLSGSKVTATNLTTKSGQADEHLNKTLKAFAATTHRTIDVHDIPDQFLNLAVVAAFHPGTTNLIGAANVRIKECDRISVMARELRKLGVAVEEHTDGLIIEGGNKLSSACICPESDHRIAMAFALAGLLSPGITIEEPECVAKSYPTFWDDLDRISSTHDPIVVVGMRAAGKTTLGKALAKRMKLTFVDIDELFETQHGPIRSFVEKQDWLTFREEEERLVAESLRHHQVIATGGGAIERPATRALLAAHAHVIWLHAQVALIKRRLATDQTRPSITGASLVDEVGNILSRRAPLYGEVADHTLDAALSIDDLLTQAMKCGQISVLSRRESTERHSQLDDSLPDS
jgi:3-phosphoshikimate 1-carboxyvinyltransferase